MENSYFLNFGHAVESIQYYTHHASGWFEGEKERQRESTRYSLRFHQGSEDDILESHDHRLVVELLDFDGVADEMTYFGLPDDGHYFNLTRSRRGEILSSSTPQGQDAFFELLLPSGSVNIGDTWEWRDSREGVWDLVRKYTLVKVFEGEERIAMIEGTLTSLPGSVQTISAEETFYFSLDTGQISGVFCEGNITHDRYHRHFLFTKREKSAVNNGLLEGLVLESEKKIGVC